MNPSQDELARLRAANPMSVEPDRGRSQVATATLARILQEPLTQRSPRRAGARGRWARTVTRSSRRFLVVLTAAFIAGGAAFAATDPLGWWNANPTYASYGTDPAIHVRTPAAQTIVCTRLGARGLRCVPATWTQRSSTPIVAGHPAAGQPYLFTLAISAPAHGITRHRLLAYISSRRAAGKMTAAGAVRFRADLAAVPDSFFTELQYASRYATIGGDSETRNGLTQVPPAGTPATIVCEPNASGLSCQNLNGDAHAPIGAGIYSAIPTRNWSYERVPPERSTLPPGITFTQAEYRVLIDLLRFAPLTSSSSRPPATATPRSTRRSSTARG